MGKLPTCRAYLENERWHMTKVPLEDNVSDIIGKAQEGLKISDDVLAAKAGISVEGIRTLKSGKQDDEIIEKIAPILGLSAPALIDLAHERWSPAHPVEFPGLARFESPFGNGLTVNAYLVWDPENMNAVLFDTGSNASEVISFTLSERMRLQLVLLTHGHSDHISALGAVLNATDARAFASKEEKVPDVETFEPGRYFIIGNLQIFSKPAPGHSKGAVVYHVSGLRRKVAIVGDTLFAGSIGRAFYSYDELLRSNYEKILSLPEDTILCPGHGPMTTVGEEKLHNPFFAEQRISFAQAA